MILHTTCFSKKTKLLKCYIFLLAFCLVLHSCIGQYGGSWYRGCFVETDDSFKNLAEIHGSLTVCSKKCIEEGSYFMALRGDTCHCLMRVDNLQTLAAEICDLRCTELEEPNLPCGGKTNAWSVYTASGPFIKEVKLQDISQWIEPNIPTTLEADISLNEFVDISEEPLIETEWKNTVEFVWQSEFTVVGVNISANSSQEHTMCTLTFPGTGNFHIALKVRNLLSNVERNFTVTVHVPKPRNLQILPLMGQWSLPSCIPPAKLMENTSEGQHPYIRHAKGAALDSGLRPVVAVFANTTFALEVSVATGSALLFNISIWNGISWEVFQHAPHRKKTGCKIPLVCRSVVQSYMFKTTGVFPVSATVSNKYGSVEANLTVVVMDQRITDVTVTLVVPDSNIVRTHEILVFHLNAVTADRQSTFIRVNFGDGVVKTAAVREKQNMTLLDSYTPTLFASYGDGCNLSLKFDHVYEKEGVYVPHITLYNNISSVKVYLKQHITVLNEIVGVRLKCDDFVPVNELVDVFIEYSSVSVNATLVWTIFDDCGSVIVNKTTSSSHAAFIFPHIGRYKITSTVSNLLNSKIATADIAVQEPIGKVSLSCNQGPYIEIEQEVVCSALAESGSDINFDWDFQEYSKSIDVDSGNLTSIAKHTFLYPGIYNISVDVHNDINNVVGQLAYSVYVEIPVECLNVITTVPSLLGEAVNIVTTATRGTSLLFYLDVGHDMKIAPHEVQVNGDATIFYVSWMFHGPANHHVTVFAYNHISNASRTVDVQVQEQPPEFSIHVLPSPLPNFWTVAVKSSKGEFLYRDDLLFHFHFSDGVTGITRVPVKIWEDQHILQRSTWDASVDILYQGDDNGNDNIINESHYGHTSVNVTISNKAGRKSKVLSLVNNESTIEKDEGSKRNKNRRKRKKKPVLWHSTFIRTDEFSSFYFANKSKDISALHIDYGNGLKESVSCLGDSCSWGRKFHVPGVFALDVSLYGRRPNRKDQALRSVLVVEEPIKGLRLHGPTDVGIGCDQEWNADLDTGSHLVYIWSLDGTAGDATTISKYVVGFSTPGTHILQINVSNDVSTAQASLNVTVKHHIVDVSVSVLPNIVGIPTNITVLIEGGREFTIDCNFGDGQYMTFFSWNLALVKVGRGSSPISEDSENQIPVYEVVLKHDFKNPGEYNVSVTVENGISSIQRSARAIVEEAIGSVVLFTENSFLLSIHNDLVVTAVVSSGRNLQFEWDFSDTSSPTVHSEGNTSTATHVFSIPDQYEISVTVSNNHQKGVRVALPFLVDVVEPISKATISHIVQNTVHRRQNAAALLAGSDGLFLTQEVLFEARADGSSVKFTFDFGDGHLTVVDGAENQFFQMMLASAKHVYTKEGAYIVKLTASNAFGNLTISLQEPFYVQIPPEGLGVEASDICIQFGKETYFNASVKSGTNVSFTWKLDDETELVDAGNYVSHMYRHCGIEHIQVTASNKVDSIQTFFSVKIVEKILGVNVSVNNFVVIAGEPVYHMAVVHPPSASLDLLYNWTFSFKESNFISSYQHSNESIMYTYMQSGRPLIQVQAVNCLSSVKSSAIQLHVVAKLKGLSIMIRSSTTVSSPVNLIANYWQGDSLTFTWDFGDGSANLTVDGSHVSHSFSRIGEYIVRLHAENPVSQIDVSRRIFVLNQPCDPPEISGLGVMEPVSQNELEFLHSEPIRVEAEIRINCTTSTQVKFKWKVIDEKSKQPINLLELYAMKNHLRCPALLLPARTLARGRYLVQLIVEMNGTEIPVYSEAEVNITVLPTPLVSIIHGGIYRDVGHQSIIHLDGRASGYPDDYSTPLGYRWSCSPLRHVGNVCFESIYQVPFMNESQLSFPANWLSSNYIEFEFNLTVFKISNETTEDRSPEMTADSSQIIRLQSENTAVDLLLECPQCWRNMVNPDRKVSLRAHCPSCSKGPLTYEWEVAVLALEASQEDFSREVQSVCSNIPESPIHHMKLGNVLGATTLASKNALSVGTEFADGVQVPKPQSQPEMITDSGPFERQESRGSERRERVSGENAESKDRDPSSDLLPDPAEDKNQGPRMYRFPVLNLSPGIAGSSGNLAIRSKDGVIGEPKEAPGGKRIYPSGGGEPTPETDRAGRSDCSVDCLMPESPPSPPPLHIISKIRHVIPLTSDQTLTGLDQASLVIKPGVLKQGRTYFVQVSAKAPDGSSGLAIAYFEVNKSPDRGKCTVLPRSGQPLKTLFKVFCSEWRDELQHLPLRYEVSYSLNGSESGDDQQVIYHGLRHRINFQLPEGLASNDYQVLVHIAIIDRLGAKTLICRIPIEVHPTHDHTEINEETDTFLHNEIISLHQLASHSVYDGFNHDLFGPLTQVAASLNAHSVLGQSGTQSSQIRARTRKAILDTLIYIPLRDEVEVIQALRCLVETTDQPNELYGVTILSARQLLKDINVQVRSISVSGIMSAWSRGLNSQILYLAVRAVSNLLTALASNSALFSSTSQQSRMYKGITSDILEVLNNLIQLELQYHSLGEKPLILQDRFLSLNASHYSIYNLSPLNMNGVQFQLPVSLEKLLTRSDKERTSTTSENAVKGSLNMCGYEGNQQCFQAHALSFLFNPFAFLKRETNMIESELASLDIYSCFGDEQIRVQDLPKEDMFKIVIPRKVNQMTNSTSRKYYLEKTAMNMHQLNTTVQYNHESSDDLVELADKYLHIHIQLEPVFEGRTFPVMVIVSSLDAPSNLRQNIFKQVYTTEDIRILLPPGSIDGGTHYYVGLVEASFNSRRRHSNEIGGRLYTLNTWWGACVYWNHTDDRWRSNGCKVLQSSSVDTLHCQCDHLTTFGGYFELIPNDVFSVSVDAFFGLHENPVAIFLIAVCLILYVVLALILRQADVHDSRKGNCVYLQDNAMTHHQKYEVLMETGCCRNAGTTSKISIILHGEEGVSETRELISDDNYPMFERKSRDRFIVTLPDSLGKIFKIQLWHNNSGSSPGWFLQQVVVRDLNTGQAFYFPCQKWLAVDKDDGKVEREFTAIDGRNINFAMIFWCKGSQYLNDFHTWLSVWTCPPHSRFTRVQRLSVCFTLLMTYMCLSAVWFKQTASEIRGEFGLLDLSWHNIIVGCFCCAIVLPLNLMLSFLFRRSRVHYPGYEQDRMLLSGKSGYELASEGEEEPVQQTITYSILDQSILNWQNIQDWAQKQWLKRQQSVRSSANSVKTTQASPQLSAPSTTPLVQQTLLAEDDTDQASSGFEDATSQVTAERQRMKAASDISSYWKRSKNVEHSDQLNASRRIFLPFWCRYVAWVLCFVISCACGAITIMCVFRFGHTRSVMWIQSIYFSFMMCLFITQPVLILVCAVYTAVCHRKNPSVFDHYDDGFYGEKVTFAGLHKQRSHYQEEEEELQMGVAARSRSRYLRFAGPPQEKQLKSSRKKLIKQRRAMLLLSDSVWFSVMFALVCIMAFGKDLQAPYHLNKALKQAFNEKQMNGTSFSQLKSAADWYRWSQSALLDTLYTQTSLRNESGHMSESLGYVLGHVQLRQLKIRPDPCYKTQFLALDRNCLYSSSPERKDSSVVGKPPLLDFRDDDKTSNPGIWGEAAWYDSSGYILQLNNSREAAAEQLKILETEKWINIQTYTVFTELTLFNAASNLFSSVTLILEMTSAGQVFTSCYITSTYMFRYISVWDNCILGCELLYVVLTLLMFYSQLHQIMKMGRRYFSHFWNYIELLMAVLSLLYIGFYVYRFVLVSEAVEFMRSTFYNEFINLAFLTWWDEVLKVLTGGILFCVILKLLRILQYHQLFWRIQIVYRRCKKELLMAAALYAGLIMAFSSLNTGIFGSVVSSMRSVWSSILATSALSVRAFYWRDDRSRISNQSPWIDIALFFSFTLCHGFVLTYIFTTLAYRLKRTKNCRVLAFNGHQLVAFYWDKILKWAGQRPEASCEQTDHTLPPEFTMAEILYLVEEMLFRMNALLGMSGLPDKRHSFTDSDASANGGDDGISSGGSEDRTVPVTTAIPVENTRLEQCVQKLEDKLCSHEPYLAQLLKLDSIGANILSLEKEQELRSHLEFEIFRQLQLQRQETAVFDVPNHAHMACPVLEPMMNFNLPANKTNGPGSAGLGYFPDEMIPQDGSSGRFLLHSTPPKSKIDSQASSKISPEYSSLSQESSHDAQAGQIKPVLLLPPKRSQSMKISGKQAGRHHITEALKTQKQWLDLSTTNEMAREAKLRAQLHNPGSSVPKYPKVSAKKDCQSIPESCEKKTRSDVMFKQDVPQSKRSLINKDSCAEISVKLREPKICKQEQGLGFNLTAGIQNASSGNISPQSSGSEKGHKRTDSSSGQSGHERSDLTRTLSKRPELPPKPTFSHVILPPKESGKALAGWSPKPRQFSFLPELMNPLGAESSSGSEQEATLSSKRVAQGRRNLRKTKSRGKGKGNEESITSPMVLAADFASGGQSGGSDFDIIIHPVPSNIDPDDHTMPEEFLS